MFAYLEGKFNYKSPALIHMDVQGVGYELHISLHTYSLIQALDNGKLYVHLQVKEDAHTLFGFARHEEKEMFLALISVSGIGAATARIMLSSLQPAEITQAIVQGNTRLIESIKGIGKKTAERLILELKDKAAKWGGGDIIPSKPGNNLQSDAVNALIALGINKNLAEQAVNKTSLQEPDIVYLEDLIKKALKAI